MPTPGSDAPILPFAGLGVAVLAASMSTILARWSTAPSLMKAFCRVLFAVALPAPVAPVRHRDALATISGRGLLAAGGAGVALAVHFASWFESFDHTTVVVSVALVQSQPFFVAVGAWAVLNERVNRHTTVGIGIAFVGMALVSISDFLTVGGVPWPLFGNGLTVAGAMTAVAYVLTGWSVCDRVSLVSYVVVVYPACVAALLAVAVGHGDPLTGYPPHEWLLFFGMTVDPGASGHTVINWAFAHLKPNVVSVSLLGEPVGSTIPAFSLSGEIPTFPAVLGGAVVLGGIYVNTPWPVPADMGSSEPGHSSEDVSVHLPPRIRYRPW